VTRVLVIDDEDVIRGLMREILERAGYETIGAETAEQALSMLDERASNCSRRFAPDGPACR
jgi:CheY-like chemotaxis protein